MHRLGADALCEIMRWLPGEEIAGTMTLVCKRMRALARDFERDSLRAALFSDWYDICSETWRADYLVRLSASPRAKALLQQLGESIQAKEWEPFVRPSELFIACSALEDDPVAVAYARNAFGHRAALLTSRPYNIAHDSKVRALRHVELRRAGRFGATDMVFLAKSASLSLEDWITMGPALRHYPFWSPAHFRGVEFTRNMVHHFLALGDPDALEEIVRRIFRYVVDDPEFFGLTERETAAAFINDIDELDRFAQCWMRKSAHRRLIRLRAEAEGIASCGRGAV